MPAFVKNVTNGPGGKAERHVIILKKEPKYKGEDDSTAKIVPLVGNEATAKNSYRHSGWSRETGKN